MPLLINTLSNVDAIFVGKYLQSIVEGRPSIGSSPFRRAIAIIVVVAIVAIVVIVVVVPRRAVAIIANFVVPLPSSLSSPVAIVVVVVVITLRAAAHHAVAIAIATVAVAIAVAAAVVAATRCHLRYFRTAHDTARRSLVAVRRRR